MAAPSTSCCQTPLYQLNRALEQVQGGDAPCRTLCSGAERQLGQKRPRPWLLGVLPAICHVKDTGKWLYTALLVFLFSERGQQTTWRTALPCKPKLLPCLHPSCRGWMPPGLQLSAVGGAVWGCALLHRARAWLPGLPSQGFPPAAGAQQGQGPCPATSSPLPKFAPHSLALVGQQPPSSPSLANTSRSPGGAAHFGADIPLPLSPLTLLLLT